MHAHSEPNMNVCKFWPTISRAGVAGESKREEIRQRSGETATDVQVAERKKVLQVWKTASVTGCG